MSSAANARLIGFDTRDKVVPGVIELIPLPEVNCQVLSTAQLDWLDVVTSGEIGR